MPATPAMERIVIAGAGALGSIYGGLLAAAGADVVLIARGPHAEAVRRKGLEVQLPDGSRTVLVAVAPEGEEVEAEGAAVIVLAKAFDTDAVLDHVRGKPSLAVSFQNGAGKNDDLARRFGPGAVVGGASIIAATLVEPGVVRATNFGATYLGELRAPPSPRVERLGELLRTAGFTTHVVEDVESLEWSKLAMVGALMAVQAVSRLYVHELYLEPDAAALLKAVIGEVAAVAAASGVELGDWPGLLPVRSIHDADEADALARLHAFGERLAAAGVTTYKTSMLQSMEAGKPTELEAIHGELVRRAAAQGIAVPVVETCYRFARLAGA